MSDDNNDGESKNKYLVPLLHDVKILFLIFGWIKFLSVYFFDVLFCSYVNVSKLIKALIYISFFVFQNCSCFIVFWMYDWIEKNWIKLTVIISNWYISIVL